MRPPTSEEILAKCPEVISSKAIRTKPHAGGDVRAGTTFKGSRKKKWWSENDRIRAATTYAVTGNATLTAEICRIPLPTIRTWRQQDWWPQVIDRIRMEHDDELDVKLTGIIDKSLEVIDERMRNGDFVYDFKRGEVIRKPMNGKETAVITSIMLDKREMLRTRKKKVDSAEQAVAERLKNLANEFVKFVKAKDVTPSEELPPIEGANTSLQGT